MDLYRMIGEACVELEGETIIGACDNVNVDHTTKFAAMRETCSDVVFQEIGIGCGVSGVALEKQLRNF